jgi:hypothetical protein
LLWHNRLQNKMRGDFSSPLASTTMECALIPDHAEGEANGSMHCGKPWFFEVRSILWPRQQSIDFHSRFVRWRLSTVYQDRTLEQSWAGE